MTKKTNPISVDLNKHRLKGRIVSRARNKKEIIFGGQSIQKQIGLKARRTKDFDVFTDKPKTAARIMEEKFDKITRGNNFYVKKGKNPKTWKVKSVGKDGIRGTRDDETIVDYTKTPLKKIKTRTINGVRYRDIKEELKAKIRIVTNKKFIFRQDKDLEDIKRIMKAGRMTRKGG